MIGAIEVDRVRSETPACLEWAYLDNAGAALMPQPVVDSVKGHLDREARIGGYAAIAERRDAFEAVYDGAARLINASAREIALLPSATSAWQQAFYAMAETLRGGDRILTAEAEYAANYVAFLQLERRRGVIVEVVPSGRDGTLDVDALERMLDERVRLIAVTWVPTNGGLVNPAARIGRIARERGIPYLLDACQAVGQMVVDVAEIGCDMLSATGRKFLRGPRGTGFLYVREAMLERLEPAMIDHYAAPWVERERYQLRDDARRFETWEKDYAAYLGLGAALDYALALGIDAIEARCRALAGALRLGLRDAGAELCDLGPEPCAIVSFRLPGIEPQALLERAVERSIRLGISRPSSTRIDAERRGLAEMVRASPHYYNTLDDIERVVNLCRDIVKGARRSQM